MAAYSEVGTLTFKREQTRVYDIDTCDRYEITGTSGAVLGCVFLRRTEILAADAPPDQITVDHT